MKENRSASLHAESVIIDGLNISRWSEETFRHLHQGGLTATSATVAVLEGFRGTIDNLSQWHRWFEQFSSLIRPVKTIDDIRRAKVESRVGIIFSFQNTSPIEDDLHLLTIFKELGVRIIQITYNERNYVGDGCRELTDCGLSRFGLEVIEEMNRLGMLIDLSHVGHMTAMETIKASKKPVTFSHANPRALCDHTRNKTDEELIAVAKTGGVIGANVHPPFLAKGSDATIEDFIDVIDYLVNLVGIEHVTIGTDFTEGQPKEFFDWLLTGRSKKGPVQHLDFPVINPKGIRSADEFPNIAGALLDRGYVEPDVKKIMGENLLRLYGEVWETS